MIILGGKDTDNIHVLCVRFCTFFVRFCTLFCRFIVK
jgi:hypothetical protein